MSGPARKLPTFDELYRQIEQLPHHITGQILEPGVAAGPGHFFSRDRRRAFSFASAFAAALVVAACSSNKDCSSDSDCSSGMACGFDMNAGCAAIGHCLELSQAGGTVAACSAITQCACDGTVTYACRPSGFAPKPVRGPLHPGASCAGDGGSLDAAVE